MNPNQHPSFNFTPPKETRHRNKTMTRFVIECDDSQAEALRSALTHMSGVRIVSAEGTDTPAAWCATPSQPVALPTQSPQRGTNLTLYTDGACCGNPGPTGMAVVVHEGDQPTEGYSWGGGHGVNNAAELSAVLSALNLAAQRRAHHVTIVTDSDYVHTGIRKWEAFWINGTLRPVAHLSLWNALFRVKYDLELAGTQIIIQCVRAHSGNPLNDLADRLAVAARKRQAYIAENFTYSAPPLRLKSSA